MNVEILKQRAIDDFMGYRTIYDIEEFMNGFDMALGFPPSLLELMGSGEDGALIAADIISSAEPHCKLILEGLQPEFTGDIWQHYGLFLEAVVQDVLCTRNTEGKDLLAPRMSELYEGALWGVLLALADENRIGEKPPVALGLLVEAQRYVYEKLPPNAEPRETLFYRTRTMCLRHGFFVRRAGYVPKR